MIIALHNTIMTASILSRSAYYLKTVTADETLHDDAHHNWLHNNYHNNSPAPPPACGMYIQSQLRTPHTAPTSRPFYFTRIIINLASQHLIKCDQIDSTIAPLSHFQPSSHNLALSFSRSFINIYPRFWIRPEIACSLSEWWEGL
jgi:hypothetical protein